MNVVDILRSTLLDLLYDLGQADLPSTAEADKMVK